MPEKAQFDLLERNAKMIHRLKISGTWFMTNGTFRDYLFNTYALFTSIYYVLMSIAFIVNVIYCLNWNNVEDSALAAVVTLAQSLTGHKAYFVVKNIKTINRLNEMAKHPTFQSRTAEQYAKMSSTFSLFDKMYKIHTYCPNATIVVFSAIALLNYRNSQLPFPAWYPFDVATSPYYQIAFFHIISAMFICANIHVNVDCLCVGMMCILITQIDLLIVNLNNIGKKVSGGDTSCTNIVAGAHEDLINCIKHHQKILKFHKDLNSLLNGIVLGQYFVSVTVICLSILEISLVKTGSTEYVACIVFTLAILVQLLIYCWWGNEIYYKSQEIPTGAYQCNFVETSTAFKKDLIFFMMRTQKPLQLKTLNFFEISLESFKGIVKNAYSVCTTLQNVNTKE